jgi:hypothetical protein
MSCYDLFYIPVVGTQRQLDFEPVRLPFLFHLAIHFSGRQDKQFKGLHNRGIFSIFNTFELY